MNTQEKPEIVDWLGECERVYAQATAVNFFSSSAMT